ncbi:hypothetical protein SDRG_05549 [Saprolegnia diclina VS20]|uniref:Uncharacterized protein n=1 Tax=Saprolegnia diclina (strain VS20) TaxID=1156394 RepID=T0QRH1_SAPDV|nr:hypothetical protein SDRG_05549 [Saprolegnia diclina VS20]EQC37331.1 hypothetical protein SDRG_05549 [Saprolegnia diclina VS20]|eukprot:XP_008609493.1 hypothetical protein SDRG_05549 [Saprolegnia diclina VS20]
MSCLLSDVTELTMDPSWRAQAIPAMDITLVGEADFASSGVMSRPATAPSAPATIPNDAAPYVGGPNATEDAIDDVVEDFEWLPPINVNLIHDEKTPIRVYA